MTVTTAIRQAGPFIGNGVTTSFSFLFKVFAKEDLYVVRTVTATGTDTVLVLDSDYTVNLNSDQNANPGGAISLLSALAVGFKLIITSDIAITQETDLTNQGGFLPEVITDSLDKLTIIAQQEESELSRTIKLAISAPTGVSTVFPNPIATSIIGWDSLGLNLIDYSPADFAALANPALAPFSPLANFAALASAVPFNVGQIVTIKCHTSGTIGGGQFIAVSGSVTNDGGTQINSATAGIYWKRLFDGPVNVKWFGALCNGVTDDSAAYILAQASGYPVIDARGCNSYLASTINLVANVQWLLQGAKLSFTGTASTMFAASAVDNWSLVGPFTLNGDLVTNPGIGVSSKAISITDCGNWRIIDPTINNVKGYGIYMDPGSSTRARGNGGSIVNPRLKDCVWGYHDNPGSGAEYCSIVNIHATGHAEAAIETAAGNTIFTGGHVLDNIKDGVRLFNGSNNTHGSFNGMNINHNGQYNLIATQVLNGETFTGCHFYGNSAGSSTGSIFFDRCKGIHLFGGHLDCEVYNYKDGSSGINMIENMYMPGGYGINKLAGSNNGHEQLIWRKNWGPGVYQIAGGIETAGVPINDPSLCYTLAQRDAGSTFGLTSGAATTLPFNVTPPFPDRRVTFNFATGTYTVPAFAAGLYKIEFDLVFNGTAMNAASSFVEFKINGTSKKVAFSNIFSTTRLQIQSSFEINLAVGDVIILVATIVGTTPTFGDATWPSNFSLKRIS